MTDKLDPQRFEDELANIRDWWLAYGLDHDRGGVWGAISHDNQPDKTADKGSVVTARTLWFFSELVKRAPDDWEAAEAAHGLRRDLNRLFLDEKHGGYVWSAKADGGWADDKKQTYAQAFAIYAMVSYAEAFRDESAKAEALALAQLLEHKTWELKYGGYLEAFAQDWGQGADQRLSEKDVDAPKTMNTHLHVLEAYTSLHRLVGSSFTHDILRQNIDLFNDLFVKPRDACHLSLFYANDWTNLSDDISYGHDIEAGWLLCEAAEALEEPRRIAAAHRTVASIANGVLNDGLSELGGLLYERHPETTGPVKEHHWWVQAEAIVGFYQAYQSTGDQRFRRASEAVWSFTDREVIDHANGEWHWFSQAEQPLKGPYKAGLWKGPYHNGRAMMEMVKRMTASGAEPARLEA
ncbi:AGE family epimerase/isomerase [Parvularcula dongshanensis]|uniref:Cellobiose 2-epimerase n=1 Tax=Parvularcula dongshanensis TaxID=1173995 RepID=A0A840I787_9PROT|nr:AGE family epimerase/isomerase [Parvularcula dongshanensis]MBB4660372.1 mannobiose 2-epimerase [Parvularcula dongshanensis]